MDFNHLPLTTEDGTQLNVDTLYKIAPSYFNSILKAWVKGYGDLVTLVGNMLDATPLYE